MVVTSTLATGALHALRGLGSAVATADSLDEIFDASLDCLSRSLRVDRSSILLLDADDVMRFRAWSGLSEGYREAVEGHSPWPVDVVDPESVLVPDVGADPSLESLMPVLDAEGIQAVAFIPLTVTGRLIGKFMLYYPAPHDFTADEVVTAEVLGAHIGLALDRFQAHEAAALTEFRYRALVESMGVAAYTTDARGLITYFNEEAATMWGRRPEIGHDLWCGSWVIYRPDGQLLPHDQCPMAIALKEGRPIRNVEILVEQPDGQRASILPFATPLLDDRGRLIGAINVLVDITDRKRTEVERQALLEAERVARAEAEAALHARDEFLSVASHELRNPVAGIRGAAQLLQRLIRRGDPKPEQIEAYANAMAETSDRMARLLDDLLDVARLESGRLTLHLEETNLSALTQELIEECRVHGASHRFDMDVEAGATTVVADALRVRQVISNLLDNAVKYSPEAGAICVSLRSNGVQFTMEVSDGGIGFSPEAAEQLFVPFGRAANARDANLPGMGLGLHIGRELVEMHGGTLRANSAGVGQGARMTLMLPVQGPNPA